MNIIDKNFYELVKEIKSLTYSEIYHRIREKFNTINDITKKNCIEFFNKFGYWGLLEPDKHNYQQIDNKARELFNHIKDFVWFYEKLGDYRSKKTLFSILNNWYRYDFSTTLQTKEMLYDDYFELDLVKVSQDEVIVDLGAYTGDTIISYLNNYGPNCYKKIYCYEITPSTYEQLKEQLQNYDNIEYRLKGISDKLGTMSLEENSDSQSANKLINKGTKEVQITTLDLDITEPITLIKADIEGLEQQALIGSKKHIVNDSPKLLY